MYLSYEPAEIKTMIDEYNVVKKKTRVIYVQLLLVIFRISKYSRRGVQVSIIGTSFYRV